ncbi:hypothetical protein NDK47_19530 [Brevibacillus ruminantium]|uniref:Uncharacterized protein n=1 Tax=Brevibacillus ruminantium TaxID=2950604 RepID=A0ABY4WI74_9BACL|nr:hypothetical protein [Brevibacillus ruminantium]USG64331.1 hypothetical protein NDK47_19530 [Brevibacillus ruminantium]
MYLDVFTTQQDLLVDLQKQVVDTLIRHRKKPYLPVWGELFYTLREISKIGTRTDQDVLVYSLHPSGSLHFKHQTGLFLVTIPDPGLTISLSLEQLIDALIAGRFFPGTLSQKRTSPLSES